MNQEKFGQFIKEIRKKNNLTQKQLAEKYNVTYQAVSKWENGKNMPDTTLIKQISKDFNISLEELFDGELKKQTKNNRNLFLTTALIISILIIIVLLVSLKNKDSDFEFKKILSSCHDFEISGSIAYNKSKTSIYITEIEYCGEETKEKYKQIECVLYESNKNTDTKISSYKYENSTAITLEEFLEKVTLTVEHHDKTCKIHSEDSLFLSINATNKNNKITTYKIPLSLENNCKN